MLIIFKVTYLWVFAKIRSWTCVCVMDIHSLHVHYCSPDDGWTDIHTHTHTHYCSPDEVWRGNI